MLQQQNDTTKFSQQWSKTIKKNKKMMVPGRLNDKRVRESLNGCKVNDKIAIIVRKSCTNENGYFIESRP